MSEAAWLAIAAFWPSLAFGITGWRNTQVAHLKSRIELLEKERDECKEQVRRLREDSEWLMQLAQRHYGVRRQRWSQSGDDTGSMEPSR